MAKALLVKDSRDQQLYVMKEVQLRKIGGDRKAAMKEVFLGVLLLVSSLIVLSVCFWFQVEFLMRFAHRSNIVQYREAFEQAGNLYIVMKYCDSGDLERFIQNRHGYHIPENQVLNILFKSVLD